MHEPGPAAFIGRLLVVAGITLTVVGAVLLFLPRVPFLGRLPGDIVWKSGSIRIYLPIATSLLISLILTGVMSLIALWRR